MGAVTPLAGAPLVVARNRQPCSDARFDEIAANARARAFVDPTFTTEQLEAMINEGRP